MAKQNENKAAAAESIDMAPDEVAIANLNEYVKKLEAENAEKDEIIAELQAAIDAQDNSGLDVPAYPTVKHNGTTYEVRARKFRMKGDPRVFELADLKDPALVAQLVEQKSGFLVAK